MVRPSSWYARFLYELVFKIREASLYRQYFDVARHAQMGDAPDHSSGLIRLKQYIISTRVACRAMAKQLGVALFEAYPGIL
jgi:hypothetical protein